MYRTTVLLAVAAIAFGQDGSGEDALDRSSMGGGGGGSSSTCGQTGQECNPCCSGNRPDSLTFRYTPGVSTISNNQEGKASISGTFEQTRASSHPSHVIRSKPFARRPPLPPPSLRTRLALVHLLIRNNAHTSYSAFHTVLHSTAASASHSHIIDRFNQ